MIRIKSCIFFLGLMLCIPCVVKAQLDAKQPAEKLNEYFDFIEHAGFSGQILVAEKDRIIASRSFGYANRETQYPVSTTTAFNIASITKQFTAVAILWLEQNNKLKTSDTLGKFWDTLNVEMQTISIHQLLTHTSGLPRQVVPTDALISKIELLSKIFATKLIDKPGNRFQYSNAGFSILAAIVEKTSGIPFEEFIRQKFIVPYKLTHTYFNADDLFPINHSIAIGYNEWSEVNNPANQVKSWATTGASNVLTTAEDIFKWFTLVRTARVLNATQTGKLFTSFVKTDEEEEHGYGWFITKSSDGKKQIYHDGDISGFHSEFNYYPENERVIYAIGNQELFGLGIFPKYRLTLNIFKILSGTPVSFPFRSVTPDKQVLARYCGTYQLDSDNFLKVWDNGGKLSVGVWGQKSIDLLVPKASEIQGKHLALSEKSLALVTSASEGQDEVAKKILSPSQYDFYFAFLKEKINAYAAAMDGDVSISLGGTIPAYWQGRGSFRTYIKLKFNSGANLLYLGWNPNGLNDITINNDRPYPFIYPLISLSNENWLIYDLDNSKATTVQFVADVNSVIKELVIEDSNKAKATLKKVN